MPPRERAEVGFRGGKNDWFLYMFSDKESDQGLFFQIFNTVSE
jgi:hypothetical protein